MESSQSESESESESGRWEAGRRGAKEKTYRSEGRGKEKELLVVGMMGGMFDDEVTDVVLIFDFLRALFFGTAFASSGSFVDSSSRMMVTDGKSREILSNDTKSESTCLASSSPSTSMLLLTAALLCWTSLESFLIERVMVFVSLNMRGGGMAPISLNVTSTGDTSPVRDPFTLLNLRSLHLKRHYEPELAMKR